MTRRRSATLQVLGWIPVALAVRGLIAALRSEPIVGVHTWRISSLAAIASWALGVVLVVRSRRGKSSTASARRNAR